MLTSYEDSLQVIRIINRAGFSKVNNAGEIDYLFLPEIFRKEVCKGFDWKFVCKILNERGYLETDGGKLQKSVRCKEMGLTRIYYIKSTIFTEIPDNPEITQAATA